MNNRSRVIAPLAILATLLFTSLAHSAPTRVAGIGSNSGSKAADLVCANGDVDCTIARISDTEFNALTPAQLRDTYDVLIFTWATDSSLNGDWATRIKPYLDLGGGVIWEDDRNIGDLAPEVTGLTGSGSSVTVTATVAGLTDGINDNFVNWHFYLSGWLSSFNPFLSGSGQTVGLYGGSGPGRMVITGPDQDFHASRSSAGAGGNQYRLLCNSIAWVSANEDTCDAVPVAGEDSYETPEDTVLTQSAPGVLANDDDLFGDTLTAVLDTDASNGALILNADGSFSYDPKDDWCGDDSFTYHANDGTQDSDIVTVSITVNCVDDPPVAVDDAKTVTEDDPATMIDVLGNDTDIDGGPKTIASASDPVNGSVEIAGDSLSLTYAPDENYCNEGSAVSTTDDFTYTLAPGGSTATVRVTVTCVNDAPVATDNAYSGDEDFDITGNVITDDSGSGVDSDVDGDSMQAVKTADPANGTVVLNADGSFTYTPPQDYCNDASPVDTFKYKVNDGPTPIDGTQLDSNEATVSLTVNCVNDAPVVTSVVAAAQTVEYYDDIVTVTITVEDVDDTSTTLAESNEPPNSAAGLVLSATGCVENETLSPTENGSTCTWTYDGPAIDMDSPNPVFDILFTASDADGAGSVTGTHRLTIQLTMLPVPVMSLPAQLLLVLMLLSGAWIAHRKVQWTTR